MPLQASRAILTRHSRTYAITPAQSIPPIPPCPPRLICSPPQFHLWALPKSQAHVSDNWSHLTRGQRVEGGRHFSIALSINSAIKSRRRMPSSPRVYWPRFPWRGLSPSPFTGPPMGVQDAYSVGLETCTPPPIHSIRPCPISPLLPCPLSGSELSSPPPPARRLRRLSHVPTEPGQIRKAQNRRRVRSAE